MSHISEIIQDLFNKKQSTDEAFNLMINTNQNEISHDELEKLINSIEIYENTLRDFRIRLRLLNNNIYMKEMLNHKKENQITR
jgi:hypothetical protein